MRFCFRQFWADGKTASNRRKQNRMHVLVLFWFSPGTFHVQAATKTHWTVAAF